MSTAPIDLQRLKKERMVLFQKEVEAGKLPSDTWPDLNDAAKVKNCYFYLSLIERFWNMMDALDVEVKEYYMARAETRYEKFVRSFEHHTGESPLPPLDVAVFWHAHALSPFRFYEDIMVRYPAARSMFDKGLPLMSIYHARNTIPKYHLERWNRWVPDEPYDLLEEIKDGTRKRFKLTCWEPLCEAAIEIPWRKYVQYRFHDMDIHFPHTCASDSESTKSHTSLNQQAKLKLDADVRARKVAGTLLERNGEDRRKENQIVEYIRIHKTVVPLDNDFDLGYEAAIQDALEALGSEYEGDANQFLHAVRTCYKSNPTMFSLDLIHAVRRQRKFYDAVTRMTWRFPDGYCTAIRRYHDFLSLMKYDPKLIAVPSIEIDCAWHTHMLFSGLYHAFCLRHMKRVINHDDTIPESKLLQHSVSTNNAWKSSNIRYKIGGKVETGQSGWSSGYKKVLTASLIPNQTPFGADYNAGKIMLFLPLDENFLKNLNTEYNKGMKTVDGMLAASRSAHSERIEPDKKETISNTYELNDEALKSIQKAITNSMYNNSSYGYVGTLNCTTGSGKDHVSVDRTEGMPLEDYKEEIGERAGAAHSPYTKDIYYAADVRAKTDAELAKPKTTSTNNYRSRSNQSNGTTTRSTTTQATYDTIVNYLTQLSLTSYGGDGGCGGGGASCGGATAAACGSTCGGGGGSSCGSSGGGGSSSGGGGSSCGGSSSCGGGGSSCGGGGGGCGGS